MTTDVQVHRIYIKAEAARIWEAITSPDWTVRYGYGGYADYALSAGGAYRHRADEKMQQEGRAAGYDIPEVIVDGEVLECDPPRRLVQTWRMLMDPGTAAEPYTTLTYEIQEQGDGLCRLTLTHEATGAPATAAMTLGDGDAQAGGGGWPWVLSDLKSLLETGHAFSR
ncbi:transcriptional regulator [Pilimelia terevasa]|uniref:Transcriptional regulator n=1 Tax=Pilimelia terevasa TaxID=53372 RepID=A0A8J3FHJ4_9ACTN|nr:SRPBCC domain-containing protein [Pilimelia terevasa]GGK21505.1 transcriptional regulator [Pilimelia terevasa]